MVKENEFIFKTKFLGDKNAKTKADFEQRISQTLGDEYDRNEEDIYWLSFCDIDKSKGAQFLGVIIIKAMGMGDALKRVNLLQINPGGEVQGIKCTENLQMIDYDKVGEKLLNKIQLKEFELI